MEQTKEDRLTAAGIKKRLRGAAVGLRVEVCDAVDSTNALALRRAAAGEPEGLAVAASSQTNGRGRMGRGFFSPDGSGVYLSLLLRPRAGADVMGITAAAAVAACEAIEENTACAPAIKWVNDILIGGRKVCGILAEARALPSAGGAGCAALGIGMNVYAPPGGFPEELRGVAGFIAEQKIAGLRDALCAGFLNSFMARYARAGEQKEPLAGAYARRSALTGKRVTVLRGGEGRAALVLGTDGECRLLVRYDDGAREALDSGEISIRPLDLI